MFFMKKCTSAHLVKKFGRVQGQCISIVDHGMNHRHCSTHVSVRLLGVKQLWVDRLAIAFDNFLLGDGVGARLEMFGEENSGINQQNRTGCTQFVLQSRGGTASEHGKSNNKAIVGDGTMPSNSGSVPKTS